MEITKTEFENFVSVATSAHVEVYEKVEPQFESTYDECKADVLGEVGTSAAESGVVSTQQMAPASKQRVDALIGHLRDGALRAEGELLQELCRVEGWGKTNQAKEKIDTLFFDFRMLQKMQGPAASHLDWQAARRLISQADEALRLKLSNQYMDALLEHVRCGTVTVDDHPVIFLCRHVINLWICGNQDAVRLKMRRLQNTLDADLEKYSIYAEHGYPVNHHETFQNTHDAPAYIFG